MCEAVREKVRQIAKVTPALIVAEALFATFAIWNTWVLVNLERLLHTPSVRLSRQRLEVLLDPEFTEVGASGMRYSREEIIALLLSSR
jgi:hypothetical protein